MTIIRFVCDASGTVMCDLIANHRSIQENLSFKFAIMIKYRKYATKNIQELMLPTIDV